MKAPDSEHAVEVGGRGHYVVFAGQEKGRHFWSPQLVMNVEAVEADEHKSELRGLFGPQPAVWTGFAAFYALSIFVAVVGGTWGAAQVALDLNPSGFIFCGVGMVSLALSYVVAWQGQRLGKEEMYALRRHMDAQLDGLSLHEAE